METPRSRRDFLADVGRGMLIAGVGFGTAVDLGLASARAGEGDDRLTFGPREPLVAMMAETPADKIVGVVIEKLRSGTSLREVVGAAALANARAFGGEDYVGFHTMMALAPSYHMSEELAEDRRALPVLKVLHRNTNRIHEAGKATSATLKAVAADCCLPADREAGDVLREAVRKKDMDGAEKIFATITEQVTPEAAFEDLLDAVRDNTEVHRVVLPYRAWDLLGLIGRENAHTLLRQSVRYCVKSERDWRHDAETDKPRTLLPAMLERHKLLGKARGTKGAEDGWVEHLAKALFEGSPEAAADAAASALAEGFAPDAVGEAISLTANQLVLRDVGRLANQTQPGKPVGSVHGDSIGVHACDSANAWRKMAAVGSPRNAFACLILGAYQVALDRIQRGGDFLHWSPRPTNAELEPIHTTDASDLLREVESAVRSNDQSRACAAMHRYHAQGHPEGPAFALLLKYAISEDGALHAEKYYRTCREEFTANRAAFRGRQLVSLARVTASEFGRPAPGMDEACKRLGLA